MNIVIEGMDFAGKSTVCTRLAAQLTATGITVRRSTTSLTGGIMPTLIEAVYRAPAWWPDRLRSTLYHLAYLPDLVPGHGRNREEQGLALQESYVCRVWAYDVAHGRRTLARVACWLTVRLHRRVDLAVLLQCPYPERAQRYRACGVVCGRDERRFAPQQRPVQEALEAALARLAGRCGYRVIDTSGRSAAEVAEEITGLIEQVRACRA
ncbi:hypothetical protein ACFQ6V_09090 [Streptomyces roseifaciens]